MKSSLQSFILTILFGTFLCMLGGYIVYGKNIFEPGTPLFQFVSFGLIGALAFYLFATRKFYLAGISILILFVVLYVINGQQHLIGYSFYFVTLVISIFIYSVLIFDHLKLAWYIRPLILAAMISIFFVSNTLFLFLIYNEEVRYSVVFKNMWVGMLIGIGLGVGFEVANKIAERKSSN